MKSTQWYPRLTAQTGKSRSTAQAGGLLLTRTVAASGLDQAMREALEPFMAPEASYHPGKILVDMAIAVAVGGEHLCDAGIIRSEPGVYGKVASDPVISRLFARLGNQVEKVEKAVASAITTGRAKTWELAKDQAPHAKASRFDPLVIDLDATLVIAHSDKEQAAPTFKKTFGHHPLLAFADHGPGGTGEPLHMMLRAGNAGSNTAKDHISVARAALASLPIRPSKKILVRTDGAGGTHDFVNWLTRRKVQYLVGFMLPADAPEIYHQIPEQCWSPALDANGEAREGADVAEFTKLLDLKEWPKDMRVIVRRERPHPGAPLRFDDVDGYRLTAFATNTRVGQHQRLELRHRRRARCEDRIRCGKDTGLRRLPLQGFGPNRVWPLVVQLANCLIAWMQMLAFTTGETGRVWEPKRLRLGLFSCPAEQIRTGRRQIVRFNQAYPFAAMAVKALTRLKLLTG